jgi:hypothetical protein
MFTIDDFKDSQTALLKMKYLANELMNNRVVIVGQNQYRLTEIEFYLYHHKWFKDSTTHQDQRQLTSDHWYFHRFLKSEKMKPFHRIGLDWTCGNREQNIFGGILIRGLMNIANPLDYLFEPSKVVKKLVNCEPLSQTYLENIETEGVYENPFIRAEEKLLPDKKVFECPRVELGNNTTDELVLAPYRFLTFGDKLHKDKELTAFKYLKEHYELPIILREFNRKTI